MKRVGILGASGYTGHELLKLLKNHPDVETVILNSRNYAGQAVSSLYKDYKENKTYTGYSYEEINALKPDLVFSALPHRVSMGTVAQLDESIKVVDLSADYRFKDTAKYEQVYKHKHSDKDAEAVY